MAVYRCTVLLPRSCATYRREFQSEIRTPFICLTMRGEHLYSRLYHTRNYLSWAFRRWDFVVLALFLLFAFHAVLTWGWSDERPVLIVVITPTHKRPERLADMTRLSQTLSHIKDLHWIVVEDAENTVSAVERILFRSGLTYAYFSATTAPGFPKRGWTHRNVALKYVRKTYRDPKQAGVVYFADDDNSYDIRLFNNYIRNVKTVGLWAVGLAGSAAVEAPHVENGTITSWDVVYAPKRKFATDMAGFAVNLDLIRSHPTYFLVIEYIYPICLGRDSTSSASNRFLNRASSASSTSARRNANLSDTTTIRRRLWCGTRRLRTSGLRDRTTGTWSNKLLSNFYC
ncbi:hypothetical protein L596_003033 [Steinernema carpocapsae]|uniref:Galactosylgalactosylxylosylprotein 3-beta-glucuronosyltransferase n=1 Tax=Steinernema carpocapsae TaxID=34508 RepID=A0A4U8URA1_STECR|nr:hypothetical protein L596_003033 [Steinernema carpocapsae]